MENVRIQSNCLRGFFNRAFILAKHQENYSRRESIWDLCAGISLFPKLASLAFSMSRMASIWN